MNYCPNYHINYFCIVITIVWTIAGVNAPTWYNATYYYANSWRNSLRLKNRKCELILNVFLWSPEIKANGARLSLNTRLFAFSRTFHLKYWHETTVSVTFKERVFSVHICVMSHRGAIHTKCENLMQLLSSVSASLIYFNLVHLQWKKYRIVRQTPLRNINNSDWGFTMVVYDKKIKAHINSHSALLKNNNSQFYFILGAANLH